MTMKVLRCFISHALGRLYNGARAMINRAQFTGLQTQRRAYKVVYSYYTQKELIKCCHELTEKEKEINKLREGQDDIVQETLCYKKEITKLSSDCEKRDNEIAKESLRISVDLLPSLECGICKSTLTQPYATEPLTSRLPCGHMYCGLCIHDWMTLRTGEQSGSSRHTARKSYPECRSLIKPKPVPAYAMKGILVHLNAEGIIDFQPETKLDFDDL
ncbi:hypothetical protein M422DRAFT_44565 [Sphaerobolus stellatus SS14]|nr:hypothetical protein M422DRAFT_44565 [Sphaerobolus stellatus SS14]